MSTYRIKLNNSKDVPNRMSAWNWHCFFIIKTFV